MGVVANVAVNIDARKPLQALRDLLRSSKRVEEQLKKKNRVIRRVGVSYEKMARKGLNGFRDLEKNAKKLGRSMQTLQSRVKLAATAFALYKATQVGIRRVESERRIKLLARSYGEVAALQAAAAASAERFNISQTEANQALANSYARLRPLGLSLDDIKSTFNGFNTAAKLGGATSQEAAAAFTQLAQALGSGALRGDEFRSIAEQAPLVLKAISDETGVAAGQLKEYAKEGKLTSDIVVKALRRIEREGAGQLKEALEGPDAAIQEFRNSAQDLSVALTTTIVPEVSTAFKELAQIIKDLEGPISFIGGLLGGALGQASKLIKRIRRGPQQVEAENRAAAAARRQVPFKERKTPAGQKRFNEIYEKELARRLAIIDGAVPGQLPASAADLPATSPPTSTLDPLKEKGKSRKGKTAEEKAFERQLELRKRLSIELKRQNALLRETDRFERSLLQIEFERQDIEAQIDQVTNPMKRSELQALADENSKMEEQNVLRQIMLDQVNSLEIAFDRERTQLEKYMDQLRKQLTDTEAIIISLSQAIETSFASAMSSAVQDAVSGTRTVGQAFAQMFADIGNAFIDLATKLLAQQAVLSILGLFDFRPSGGTSFSQGVNFGLPQFGDYSGINNFGGFFANGGPVSSGKSYVVGERGPELFVPRSSGTIVPNDKMSGGGVQVGSINIKVENTGDQLSPQAQKQLANQVQGIVLSTLTNERRSGGML